MSKSTKQSIQDTYSYEVITQEDAATGDTLLPIPPELLRRMGWREGDTIDFSIDEQGRWILRKV